MTPNAAPLDRAAIAREVLTQLVNEFMDGTLSDAFRLTPAQRARMLGYIDGEYPAPSPTPPPIPLGAVVEVEDYAASPFGRYDKGWMDDDETCWPDADAMGRAPLVTALYHARREREEATQRALDLSVALQVAEAERDAACGWQDQADAWCAVFDALEVVRPGFSALGDTGQEAAVRAIRELASERDAARRALVAPERQYSGQWNPSASAERQSSARLNASAATQDQGLGHAVQGADAPNSEVADCGIAVASPAPASAPLSDPAPLSGAGNTGETGKPAPRRWWLVVGPDGVAVATMEREEDARAYADTRNFVRSNPAYCSVVPVIEARVTRETVERVAEAIAKNFTDFLGDKITMHPRRAESHARAALSALGLTVEGE